jgi:hypothetical protein
MASFCAYWEWLRREELGSGVPVPIALPADFAAP